MHLSDEQLNEYLDGALAPVAHAEAVRHLAACADCAARLTALQSLFVELESLPDLKLARDLAGPVTHLLRQRIASASTSSPFGDFAARRLRAAAQGQNIPGGRRALPRWIRLTAVLEAALAVTALLLAAPVLNEFASSVSSLYEWPSPAELLLQVQNEWTLLTRSVPEFSLPAIPTLSLEVSSLALTLTGLAAFLLWVVGNGLLLKRMTRPS